MPKPQKLEDRERIDLHAPWYSAELVPSPVPVRTLILKPDLETWEYETPYDEETHTHLRYVEHVTVYAHGLHEDQVRVAAQVQERMRLSKNRSGVPKGDDIARTRTLLYLRRILEVTDDAGTSYQLSEPFFRRLDDQETEFIDSALEELKRPVVPVLDADRERATERKAQVDRMVAAGAPIPDEQLIPDEEAYAETLAYDAFPGDAEKHLLGQG